MTTQTKFRYRLPIVALAILLCGALLAGCGGTGDASTGASSSTGATDGANHGKPSEPGGDSATSKNAATASADKAACERAVQLAPALATDAKREIAGLCFRINYIVEDNEKTVRAVCQEVANASTLTSDAARKRTVAACYAAGMR